MQDGICFCGVRENFGEQSAKLPMLDPTWFFQGSIAGLEASRVRSTIAKALAGWSKVCALRWREADSPQSATLRIITERIDGPGNVLADCQLPYPNFKQLLMRLDAEKYVDVLQPVAGTIGLYHVVAHEGGHAEGFGHLPFDGTPDLMNPTYNREVYEPQADEAMIARRMYGPPVDFNGVVIPKLTVRLAYPDGSIFEASGVPKRAN